MAGELDKFLPEELRQIAREPSDKQLSPRGEVKEKQKENPILGLFSPSKILNAFVPGPGLDLAIDQVGKTTGLGKEEIRKIVDRETINTASDLFRRFETIKARTAQGLKNDIVSSAKDFVTIDPKKRRELLKKRVSDNDQFLLGIADAFAGGREDQFEFGDLFEELGAGPRTKATLGFLADILTDPGAGELIKGVSKIPGAVKSLRKAVKERAVKPNASVVKNSMKEVNDEVGNIPEKVVTQLNPASTPDAVEAIIKHKSDELVGLASQRVSGKVEKQLNKRINSLSEELTQLRHDKIIAGEVDFAGNRVRKVNPAVSFFSTFVESKGRFGSVLARQLRKVDDTFTGLRGKYLSRIEPKGKLNQVFKGTSKSERFDFVAHLEGFGEAPARLAKTAVGHAQNWAEIADSAVRLGVRTAKAGGKDSLFKPLSKGKFPHIILRTKDVIANPRLLDDAIEYNVRIGRFDSVEEGRAIWQGYKDVLGKHVNDSVPIAINKDGDRFFKWLQKNGESGSVADIEKRFRRTLTRVKQNKFGNLEFSRQINIPFYHTDPTEVLTRYYSGSAKRLSQFEHLGGKNEVVEALIAKMPEEVSAADIKFMREGIDLITEVTKPRGHKWEHAASGALRNIQVASKLSRAVFMNLTQSKNTAALAGFKNTANALREGLTKEGQEFAFKSGAVFDEFAQALYGVDPRGATGKLASFVLDKTGFSTVEKYNRVVSAIAGRNFASELAQKLVASGGKGKQGLKVARMLRKMDIDPNKILRAGVVDEEDLFQAARNMATRTQFRNRVLDSPLWTQGPWGKITNQFKNFIENETKFVKDELIREAVKNGNWAPIARYAAVAPPLGFAGKKAREFVSEVTSNVLPGVDPRPKEIRTIPQEMFDSLAAVGALGIYYDVYQAVLYNDENFLQALIPAGETVGEVGAGTFQALASTVDEDTAEWVNTKPLLKSVTKLIPFIGSDASRIFESESTKKARFTRAATEAKKSGLSIEPILKQAKEQGISKSDIKQGVRRAKTNKKKKVRERDRKVKRLSRRGKNLQAALLRIGLGEV